MNQSLKTDIPSLSVPLAMLNLSVLVLRNSKKEVEAGGKGLPGRLEGRNGAFTRGKFPPLQASFTVK